MNNSRRFADAPRPRARTALGPSRLAEILARSLDDLLPERSEIVVFTLVAPVCDDVFPPPPDCYGVGLPHPAYAVIRDNDSPRNRPPLVRLTQPEDGAAFLAPANIRLIALARDFDGDVTAIAFFARTTSLGIVRNPRASAWLENPRSPSFGAVCRLGITFRRQWQPAMTRHPSKRVQSRSA